MLKQITECENQTRKNLQHCEFWLDGKPKTACTHANLIEKPELSMQFTLSKGGSAPPSIIDSAVVHWLRGMRVLRRLLQLWRVRQLHLRVLRKRERPLHGDLWRLHWQWVKSLVHGSTNLLWCNGR